MTSSKKKSLVVCLRIDWLVLSQVSSLFLFPSHSFLLRLSFVETSLKFLFFSSLFFSFLFFFLQKMGRITLYTSSQSGNRAIISLFSFSFLFSLFSFFSILPLNSYFIECGDWAKQVLDGHKVAYMEVDVSMMLDQQENMYALSLGLNKNLPQLYFNNKIIAVCNFLCGCCWVFLPI